MRDTTLTHRADYAKLDGWYPVVPAGRPPAGAARPGAAIRLLLEADDIDLVGQIVAGLPKGVRLHILPSHRTDGPFNLPSGTSRPRVDPKNLTGRQREIGALVARGLSNKQIGRLLDLSHLTVRNHLSQLFRSLGVSTRGEAADRLTPLLRL